MQKFKEKKIESLHELICDVCKRSALVHGNDYEAAEFVSINYTGGYKSIFGDNTKICIDICQYCFKDKLGTWLQISQTET